MTATVDHSQASETVIAVSMTVIGRSGWSAAPEPPSMWSTAAIAMSSG